MIVHSRGPGTVVVVVVVVVGSAGAGVVVEIDGAVVGATVGGTLVEPVEVQAATSKRTTMAMAACLVAAVRLTVTWQQ